MWRDDQDVLQRKCIPRLSKLERSGSTIAKDRASLSEASEQFNTLASTLHAQNLSQLSTLLTTLKSHLQTFTTSHPSHLQNPQLRSHLNLLFNTLGIDPLSTSAPQRSVWASVMGNVGDFYFGLGVQVVEACMMTRESNGGLIEIGELREMVERRRRAGKTASKEGEITIDDILKAIKTLEPLGSGFKVLQLGEKTMVQSLPRELNLDFSTVLVAAQATGYVTLHSLTQSLQWTEHRAQEVLVSEST
ncbi:hypothetical protein HDV05_000773 [Chytridiales sp. JEL 0842]|nr:hypothetical protein HDV05_000773 [Chytridiales sp. JEL 0842]